MRGKTNEIYRTLKGFNVLMLCTSCYNLIYSNLSGLFLKLQCKINTILHLRLTVMLNSNSIAEGLRDGSDSPQRSED